MSSRKELKELRAVNRRRQNYIVVGIIALSAFLFTGAIILPSLLKKNIAIIERPQADYTSMGDKNAKVKVEEFSDFQCPHCGQFALTTESAYVEKYVETGKVYFTFVPFSFMGEASVKSAEAAYCAADQGKFWEYRDQIFGSQLSGDRSSLNRSGFISFAQTVKLEMGSFEECIDNGIHNDKVMNDIAYAQSKGVNATPYFIVNGALVDSSQLEAAIETALQAN
ncbi:MAG: thioredoxin domain-containing protein [Leptolinea sp.]|nr:thioredoxin domain-containing protein [Leptolinea sp.]